MNVSSQKLSALLSDYYRCPPLAGDVSVEAGLPGEDGYFNLHQALTCSGKLTGVQPAKTLESGLPAISAQVDLEDKPWSLPFDPVQVVDNLRWEKYQERESSAESNAGGLVRRLYYMLRPLMPVHVRKHLQRLSLRGWDRIPFPHWPVDRTVDQLHEWLLSLALRAGDKTEIPFVWFWPEGYSSCISITHDVETAAGRDFCSRLMDLNDSYGVKSSFQVIPEERYEVPPSFLDEIRKRKFEVNIHDLNHDGQLFFIPYEQFVERLKKINDYGHRFKARGFRSAVLYRRQEWMKDLSFAYDMSVPNVAHLDPQRGGCCTVMPFFMGDLLEIPVTATQDYTLFHILCDYSTNLWQRQITTIAQKHGLASFIIHPDYVIEERARNTYEKLLKLVTNMRSSQNTWVPKPAEICDWWRARSRMVLMPEGKGWRVEGEASERARVAFARIGEGGIEYRVEQGVNCSAVAG